MSVYKSGQDWSATTSWDAVCRRAAGRARWNAVRRLLASVRRCEVARLLLEFGPYYSPLQHGIQVRIARTLNVSEATISRDLRAIFQQTNRQACPACGLAQLTPDDWERLDAAIDAHSGPSEGVA